MVVRSSWRIGQIAGIDIAVHPSWLIIFALFSYVATLGAPLLAQAFNIAPPTRNPLALGIIAALLLFVCVVVHELSHAIVARRLGIPIGNITLFLFGGMASILREPGTPGDEIKMAAAGPLASVGLAACFALIAFLTRNVGSHWIATLCVFLAFLNVVLALFNLLPAFPTDGGRILRAIIWLSVRSQAQATTIAAAVSAVVAAALVAGGVLLLFNRIWNGGWLILIALFLLQAAIASGRQARVSLALERMRVGDCMARTLIPIAEDAPLTTFVGTVTDTRSTGYPVVENGAFVGLVNPRDAGAVPPTLWEHTPVRAIMTPAARLPVISADAAASEALAALAKTGVKSLPVFENGELVGVVSEETVFAALRQHGRAAAQGAAAA